MHRWFWVVSLILFACQPSERSDASERANAQGAPEEGAASEQSGESNRAVQEAKIAVRALSSVELDALSPRERACDDAELRSAAPTQASRVLTTRFAEARADAKELLPLSVTERLELPQLSLLESALSGVHGEQALRQARLRSAELRKSRFIGVFHVTRLRLPRFIWRLDRKKPEWVSGHVEAWLAVHDAQSGERLCQTRIWVENDTKDAPLTRRLRADTRDKLTSELGQALEHEAPAALKKLSGDLALPASKQTLVSRL